MLIKNGRIIDPESKRDEIADILVEEGIITKIHKNIDIKDEVFNAKGKIIAPGLIDVHVHFREPGFEYKEDILSGSKAAARGGFTTVVCMANTAPVIDNIETLKYINDIKRHSQINVLQVATVTKGLKGTEIVNMEELKKYGAAGFSDDGLPIMDTNIVLNAMLEAKRLNLPISFHEEDPGLIYNPGVNDGKISEKLGVKGASHLAEDVMVARDCIIALKTGAKVNFQHISSGLSVDIIRWAKSMGANITAEASPHHFSMTEEDIFNFNTNAKINPPLRTENDRMKLIDGLKDGTIDIIATDHAPHGKEEKSREFSKAPSGIIGLETALSVGITYLVKNNHLTIMQLLEKMTVNPARLYNLQSGIKEGKKCDLVVFDIDEKWIVDEFYSKSSNSPFIGKELCGKVMLTICNGKVVYKDK
ncbi:MAG: dihydroorotase [Tissierellia bacterium]|jgi:dihydroorotase|nr:dihydroorotase [Tissierellia bacterium]MDD3750877.1 dihydroorotase [Tissierellia bacterium]MDD4045852.1 dihydroorotase [Tissierellia bacterium]MDD4678030.1 dihydroorotase [Tissierellia bacterium]